MPWRPYPRAEVEERERPSVIGLRLRARSAAAARKQWAELLGARLREHGGLLVFDWPGSPLRISVEVSDAAEQGPVGIEIVPPAGSSPVDTTIDALGCRILSV